MPQINTIELPENQVLSESLRDLPDEDLSLLVDIVGFPHDQIKYLTEAKKRSVIEDQVGSTEGLLNLIEEFTVGDSEFDSLDREEARELYRKAGGRYQQDWSTPKLITNLYEKVQENETTLEELRKQSVERATGSSMVMSQEDIEQIGGKFPEFVKAERERFSDVDGELVFLHRTYSSKVRIKVPGLPTQDGKPVVLHVDLKHFVEEERLKNEIAPPRDHPIRNGGKTSENSDSSESEESE